VKDILETRGWMWTMFWINVSTVVMNLLLAINHLETPNDLPTWHGVWWHVMWIGIAGALAIAYHSNLRRGRP
jgi:hypothetical protein